jgi:hypothetical protein
MSQWRWREIRAPFAFNACPFRGHGKERASVAIQLSRSARMVESASISKWTLWFRASPGSGTPIGPRKKAPDRPDRRRAPARSESNRSSGASFNN